LGGFDLSGIPPAPRGTPQIEVTFEIDENSILTVNAHEKGTGSTESLTITNDKGRLTKEEIEKMIEEAEQFADQDKEIKEKLDAKHQLENYIYQMRNTIEDPEKLADKLDEDDKTLIADALQEAQDWLSSNEEAEKDEFEEHFRSLQSVCDPIIAKVYQDAGGQGGMGDDDEEFEDL